MSERVPSPAVLAILLLGLAPAAQADLPILRLWPGDPPCDTTLQACIDGADPDDGIRIATAGPIDESIAFAKSLSLTAQPGFRPVFSAGHGITATTATTGAYSITIQGLTFAQGTISVTQSSTDPMNVQIRDNTIALGDPAVAGAISVEAPGAFGTVTFDVSGNTVAVPTGFAPGGIYVGMSSNTSASGQIANNSIQMLGATQGSGIYLSTGPTPSGLDMVANRVSGTAYRQGIIIYPSTQGATTLRVLNNLVTGQGTTGSLSGALLIQSVSGTLDVSVLNNTIAGNAQGLGVFGGNTSGLVANNLVANNTAYGFAIGDSLAATVANSNNLVFDNGGDSFTPGTGTVTQDPLFVSATDYHLRPGSPAIDSGDDAAVPADLSTDLDGNPRIQGSHVDIGAFEAPEPRAALCAAASLGALAALASLRIYLKG